jgi:hypothetical protein
VLHAANTKDAPNAIDNAPSLAPFLMNCSSLT